MPPIKPIITICLTPFAMMASLWAQDAGTTEDPGATKELIHQWVKTERMISEEKTSWEVEKKSMQSLLDLYRKELALLNEELTQAGASVELVDHDKEKLEAELKQYREAQQLLRASMARMLPRMKNVITRFPQPLADELKSDLDALSAPDALGKPRDVLKSMLAVLSAAGRFNRSITVAEETQTLPDGKKMTVSVLYLGLCRAYYTTSSGDTAGIGSPGKEGWVWQSVPAIAADVRRAIAVYQKSQQPQLIKLPVKLTGGGESK
ncbi:MAG: DUF3450 family protein [Akkermansiaceae bacterium]|nr:DUF3450 family protein [Akkermansiaceae bacterium]